MADLQDSLRKLVNASGFLFQLRVEQEIRATQPSRRGDWEVVAHEHRWIEAAEGGEGFIDIILRSGFGRMIIECKRVMDASWVFLVPDQKNQTARSRLLWTVRNAEDQEIASWHDFYVLPISAESAFCAVRGQGEKDVPMLERIASHLLKSVESFASEELSYTSRASHDPIIYFPVIVTNAALYVCHFDPLKVDLASGQLAEGDFKQVPYIRFRKTLSSNLLPREPPRDVEQSNQENERTVFIVNPSD